VAPILTDLLVWPL